MIGNDNHFNVDNILWQDAMFDGIEFIDDGSSPEQPAQAVNIYIDRNKLAGRLTEKSFPFINYLFFLPFLALVEALVRI